MPKIKNKSGSKLAVEVAGGRFIHLLSGAEADVTERDLNSPHLAGFIKRGEVRKIAEVAQPAQAKTPKKKKKKKPKEGEKGSAKTSGKKSDDKK